MSTGEQVQSSDLPNDSIITDFNQSEFARLLGMEITEARDGYARVIMDGKGKNNPRGVAHGGAVFALADQAFGIAANCCGGAPRVAVSIHIQYLSPATASLVAIARRVEDNGTYSTFRVMVYEGERIIAMFDGVAILLDISATNNNNFPEVPSKSVSRKNPDTVLRGGYF